VVIDNEYPESFFGLVQKNHLFSVTGTENKGVSGILTFSLASGLCADTSSNSMLESVFFLRINAVFP